MPDASTPDWIRRFTAPRIGFPRWGRARPERLAFVSSESGSWQAWAADLEAATRWRISNERVGVEEVLVTPDGERVVWWHDATGDERGHWVAVPFAGGDPAPLLPELPDGWSMGISLSPSTVAVGLATDEEYRAYVAGNGGPPRLVYRHTLPAGVGREWPQGSGGLSADGSLLCIRHVEHGDLLHPALRVVHAETGETVGNLEDPGRRLEPVAWSPVPGDPRLAILHERGAFERPALWNLETGVREDLEVDDLPGAVFPVDWYPDGTALLVRQEHEGVDELHRLDLATGRTQPAARHRGQVHDAAVRPEAEAWLLGDTAERPPRLLDVRGGLPLAATGDPAPPGRPFRAFWFEDPAGQRVQAWVATPAGDGPHPTVVYAHGGPEWHQRDGYDPEIQAYVDHGFAVAMVNYRGSTGYGVAFRETLVRNIGFPESEDLLACLDALSAEGTADADRAFLAGWSWGGYLGCLNVGLHPDRYRAVFAGIPTGDYVDAHWNCAPPIQAWDVAIMGGHPDEVPDLYRERDPMTYVERGRAPVLIIAGRNDSRCPLSSVERWVDAYRSHGGRVEVHLYDAGHHANDVAAQARHVGLVCDFFRRFC